MPCLDTALVLIYPFEAFAEVTPFPMQPLGPMLKGQNADCPTLTDSVVTFGSAPTIQRSGLYSKG